jgi:arsenate reductase (glutaredoxin)
MTVQVSGIKSCDTCRKARKWLEEQGIVYQWADLREQIPARSTLVSWLDAAGAERLVNRRSTTWRGLDEQHRPALDSPELPNLLLEHPALIKRPVFERGGEIRVGFDEAARRWLLQE